MSTVLYDEDDDFTREVYREEEISENAVNRPDQIVWADNWDLEEEFKVHIRSDNVNKNNTNNNVKDFNKK